LDGFPLIAPYGSTIALVVVIVALTYLSLIFGELVPKQIALENAERVAARVARPMRLVARIGGPVVAALGWSSVRLMSAGIFAGVIATQELALGLSQLGTDGSNPSPSSKESVANLTLESASHPLPAGRRGTKLV
jgi:putative hemolysin